MKNAHNLTPRQIIAEWCEAEDKGFDWKRVGPDDLSKCTAEFRAKMERTIWACRVAENAIARISLNADRGIIRAFALHRVHRALPSETARLRDALPLSGLLETIERQIDAEAKAQPKTPEFEMA